MLIKPNYTISKKGNDITISFDDDAEQAAEDFFDWLEKYGVPNEKLPHNGGLSKIAKEWYDFKIETTEDLNYLKILENLIGKTVEEATNQGYKLVVHSIDGKNTKEYEEYRLYLKLPDGYYGVSIQDGLIKGVQFF